jgi:hypothetical protein
MRLPFRPRPRWKRDRIPKSRILNNYPDTRIPEFPDSVFDETHLPESPSETSRGIRPKCNVTKDNEHSGRTALNELRKSPLYIQLTIIGNPQTGMPTVF